MTNKRIYVVCDLVLNKLKESTNGLAPLEMDLDEDSITDESAINLLIEHKLIKFIGGVTGFHKYCVITTKGLYINNGIEKYLKSLNPTPLFKKIEFIIPSSISLLALIIPFIIINLDKKELKEYSTKKYTATRIDSISTTLNNQQDSLLLITNSRIDSLITSYKLNSKN